MTNPGRNEIKRALRNGSLIKPEHCENCKDKYPPYNIVAHHHKGYDKLHILDIVWLCRKCHHNAHGGWDGKGVTKELLSSVAKRTNEKIGHDQLSSNGKKGMKKAQQVMKLKYTQEQLSQIRSAAAIKGNKIRWGDKNDS